MPLQLRYSVFKSAAPCSSQDKQSLAQIKFALSCLGADFISLLVKEMLPKAGQLINIIKVYLPMESITSDSFPIGRQDWNAAVSDDKVLRTAEVANRAMPVPIQVIPFSFIWFKLILWMKYYMCTKLTLFLHFRDKTNHHLTEFNFKPNYEMQFYLIFLSAKHLISTQ